MVLHSKMRNPQQQRIQIRSVWAHNLATEFELIRHSVDRFPFAAMDTEFPGVIFRPPQFPHRSSTLAEIYSALKFNVDSLSLIQLGLTLSNSAGDLPSLGSDTTRYMWEFNFSDFDIDRDMYNADSIALLKSNGMDFDKNRTNGINSVDFAYYMMSSGLILNESMTWVTFHSAYDFAYLVKILSGSSLPEGPGEFMEMVKVYFGAKGFFDMKYMMRYCDGLYGGLDRVAGVLGVGRVVGRSHQAGSDSLLTWQVFLKMREMYFAKDDGGSKFGGVLFGLLQPPLLTYSIIFNISMPFNSCRHLPSPASTPAPLHRRHLLFLVLPSPLTTAPTPAQPIAPSVDDANNLSSPSRRRQPSPAVAATSSPVRAPQPSPSLPACLVIFLVIAASPQQPRRPATVPSPWVLSSPVLKKKKEGG